MAVEKILIPFCGYPIYKISTGEILSKDELKILKKLDKAPIITTSSPIELTKDVNILDNNKELTRIKDVIWNCFVDYKDNILFDFNQNGFLFVTSMEQITISKYS